MRKQKHFSQKILSTEYYYNYKQTEQLKGWDIYKKVREANNIQSRLCADKSWDRQTDYNNYRYTLYKDLSANTPNKVTLL